MVASLEHEEELDLGLPGMELFVQFSVAELGAGTIITGGCSTGSGCRTAVGVGSTGADASGIGGGAGFQRCLSRTSQVVQARSPLVFVQVQVQVSLGVGAGSSMEPAWEARVPMLQEVGGRNWSRLYGRSLWLDRWFSWRIGVLFSSII